MLDHRRDTADFHIVQSGKKAWVLHAESHELYEIKEESLCSDTDAASSINALTDVVHEDLARLRESDYLSHLNRDRLEMASPMDGADLALNINLTSVCNLGCTYCFAEGGDYGRIKGKLNANTDLDAILKFVPKTLLKEMRFDSNFLAVNR